MDPDAALARLRELVRELDAAVDDSHAACLGDELATVFSGLDEWMTKNGAPPRAWATGEVVP